MINSSAVIKVENLKTCLGGTCIHNDINFTVSPGEIVAIAGGSGSGKSTLLRQLLRLLHPTKGQIYIFNQDIARIPHKNFLKIQRRCGTLFQQGALFSSLTVLENIAFPLREFTSLNPDTIAEIALFKLALAGLTPDTANKYPAELSGGMQKRAALARALALDPSLLFLDEPGSGLDPISASAQDALLLKLKEALHLTIVMVTHDLNTLATVADRIIFLGERTLLAEGTFDTLQKNNHPEIHAYFHNARAKAASLQEQP